MTIGDTWFGERACSYVRACVPEYPLGMWFMRKKSKVKIYNPPMVRAHRSFAYLDDDVVINSLSALESGKVDEVVEKINLAQSGGRSVGVKADASAVGVNASSETSSSQSLQAEVIRRRTRFSIFELWYSSLKTRGAIGKFESWGEGALETVEAGQVVELRGYVEPVALHTGIRMFLWFVNEVREGNPLFTENSSIQDLQQPEFTMQFLRGKRSETPSLITPIGPEGPSVAASFQEEWILQPVGRWSGIFSLVAQVEEIIPDGESWQAVRIIEDAPLTALEEQTIKDSTQPFRESMGALGVELDDDPAIIPGPLMVLRPIAMFR